MGDDDYNAATFAQNAGYYRKARARDLAPELVEALRELWRYGVNSEAVSIEEYHCALDRTGTLLARIEGGAA